MLIKLLIICVLSLLVTTEKVRYDNYALYKLYTKSEEQLQFLKDLHENGVGLDFWHLPTQVGDYASVVSTPEQRGNFEQSLWNQKIQWDLMQENIQEAFDAQMQSRHKRSTNRELFWTAYQTQEQITEWFYQLASNHDFVSVVHAGNSYEGRNITGIRIARSSSRRAFFIEGGQVGADWLSPTVLTYFVDQLIRGEYPEAKAASEEFEWHIFPVINPDGFKFTQDSVRLWTKNRRPLSLPGGRSGIGADLTRNWNSQWGVSGGSFNLAANNFIGLGPFSEIETRVVSRYIESIASNLVGVLSFRQFGQRLLIPFAHSSAAMYNYDEMLTVGRRAMGSMAVRYGTQYIVGTSRNVHDGSTGILADWVKHRFNPPIVATYHLRDVGAWGYTLPVNQVLPSCEETFDSLLAIIREAKFIDII